MPRVRKGAARHRKHKRVLRAARGYYGAASRRYRTAKQAVFRAGVNATHDRKTRKRDFRRLWITRITAACRQRGIMYSRFIYALEMAGIRLNRKMLSEIAIADPGAFDRIVEAAMDPKAAPAPAPEPEAAPEPEPKAKAKAAPAPEAKAKAVPAPEPEAEAAEKKPAPKAAKKATKKATAKKKAPKKSAKKAPAED